MGDVVDQKSLPRKPVGKVPPDQRQDKSFGLNLRRQDAVMLLEAQKLDEKMGLVVDLTLELVGPGHHRVAQKTRNPPAPAERLTEKVVEGHGLVLRAGEKSHLGPVGRLMGDPPQLPPDLGGVLPVGGDGEFRRQGKTGGPLLPKVQGHPAGAPALKDTAEKPRQAPVVAVY